MFIPTIVSDQPLPLTVLSGNDEFIVRIPIGYDDENSNVYSLFAALAPLAGYADIPGYELVFCITEALSDGSEIRQYWDGTEITQFLTDPTYRRDILICLTMALVNLVKLAKPNLISMSTHTANLPDSGLRKFNLLCGFLGQLGFSVCKSDVWHGQHTWMMSRQDGTEQELQSL